MGSHHEGTRKPCNSSLSHKMKAEKPCSALGSPGFCLHSCSPAASLATAEHGDEGGTRKPRLDSQPPRAAPTPLAHVFGLDAGQLNPAPALVCIFFLLSLSALSQLPRTEEGDQKRWRDPIAPFPAAAATLAAGLCLHLQEGRGTVHRAVTASWH